MMSYIRIRSDKLRSSLKLGFFWSTLMRYTEQMDADVCDILLYFKPAIEFTRAVNNFV